MFVDTPLVSPREKTLGTITVVLGIITWLLLTVVTIGIIWIFVFISFIVYLFAQSAFVSYIKGNGVELTAAQFPDLHNHFLACCQRLEMTQIPRVYLLNGGGMLNAFALHFLGANYVVLLTDIVDAMEEHPDGVRFYMGHELGHIRMKHLTRHILRLPVLWIPLLGAAYSRAQETTCDLHGLACSASKEGAVKAMAALATGPKRWKDLNLAAYTAQTSHTSGFWMSFHELSSGYPWLTKRVARLLNSDAVMPKRNPLAYFFAMCIPYSGRLGPLFSILMMLYVALILFLQFGINERDVLDKLAGQVAQEHVLGDADLDFDDSHANADESTVSEEDCSGNDCAQDNSEMSDTKSESVDQQSDSRTKGK